MQTANILSNQTASQEKPTLSQSAIVYALHEKRPK